MKSLSSIIVSVAFLIAVASGAYWLVTHPPPPKAEEKPKPPAVVVKEEDLIIVTLKPEAEQRLGLTLGTIAKKPVRRVRVYGGEVTIPIGKTIPVAAPLGGTLQAPKGILPKAGETVKSGQCLFLLTPLLTPEGKATLSAMLVEADGQMNSAEEQLKLANVALMRAKKVFGDGAGSQRQVDESQAAHAVAEKLFAAAKERRSTLSKAIGEGANTTPIPIEAPEDGLLRTLNVQPGQTVPAGAALFEIIDLTTIWIRVPLPVNDFDEIDIGEAVQAGKLSGAVSRQPLIAKPVKSPPSANPLASTVDLFYESPNPNPSMNPGQRLGVTIPLKDRREGLTVPWSAIVFDIHGGAWIYECIGERKYLRRRIVIDYTIGDDAVLGKPPTGMTGLSEGTKIVTSGTLELYAVETGFVK